MDFLILIAPPAYSYRGVGQVLFYRARMDGAIAAVVGLTAGPVRWQPGLGGREGRCRITLRYAVSPDGAVRVHRGWLHVGLPAGTRLRMTGYQVDGPDLLISLRPIRPAPAAPERLEDRFQLPFGMVSWGLRAIRGVSARLRLSGHVGRDFLCLHGRLRLVLETAQGERRLVIPFCRLLPAAPSEGLHWRVRGGLVDLTCRVEPGGSLVGEAVLAVTWQGRPPAGPPPAPPLAVAVVRELSSQMGRVTAEHLGEGQVLLRGTVELDIAWADQAGRGRWTGLEAPFSALLAIPGLLESDRLEPVARVDRLSRVGAGAGSRAALLVAVGVTALRTVHLDLNGQWYRVEQVVGQAVSSLSVDQPLFAPPAPAPQEESCRAVAVPLPEAPGTGWRQIRLQLKRPVAVGGEWRSALGLAAIPADGPDEPGEVRLSRPLSGPLPAGAAPLLALDGLGSAGARVRALALPQAGSAGLGGGQAAAGEPSQVDLELPAPLRAMPRLLLQGGPAWEARLLVGLQGGLCLLAADLPAPAGGGLAAGGPLAATAYGTGHRGEGAERIRLEVWWKQSET